MKLEITDLKVNRLYLSNNGHIVKFRDHLLCIVGHKNTGLQQGGNPIQIKTSLEWLSATFEPYEPKKKPAPRLGDLLDNEIILKEKYKGGLEFLAVRGDKAILYNHEEDLVISLTQPQLSKLYE